MKCPICKEFMCDPYGDTGMCQRCWDEVNGPALMPAYNPETDSVMAKRMKKNLDNI